MPELPEVETIRRQLAERIPGRSFAAVEVHDPKLVSPEDPAAFVTRVAGQRVRSVDRRGKYLLVELESGDTLAVHLRMTGRLHWRPGPSDEEERFLRARFDLDDGSTLTFGDMRRFGRAWIVPAGLPIARGTGPRGSASSPCRRGSPPASSGTSSRAAAGPSRRCC